MAPMSWGTESEGFEVSRPGVWVAMLVAFVAWQRPDVELLGQSVVQNEEVLAHVNGPIAFIVGCDRRPEFIWVGSQNKVYEFRIRQAGGNQWVLEPERSIELPMGHVYCAVPDHLEDFLWIGGGDPGQSGTISKVDFQKAEVIETWELHADVVTSLAVSADGQRLASTSWDQTVAVFDRDFGRSQGMAGHSGGVTGLTWVDDHLLVTGSEDHTLRVWNVVNGGQIRAMEHHTGGVVGLVQAQATVSEGQKASQVATIGRDRTVRLWQPERGRMVRFVRLDSQPKAIMRCEWKEVHRDGDDEVHRLADTSSATICAVGGDRGQLWIIDMDRAKVIFRHQFVARDWIQSLYWNSQFGFGLAGTSQGAIFGFFP